MIRRRSLVVLISDFITAPGWERPLLQLTERHEVVAIRLLDPREYELPDAGVIVVEDAETGEQLMVDSSDPEFRRRLREAGEQREARAARRDPPRRRRHPRGVDRRRSRPGVRPHRRVAQAAAPLMSFGSPWMLLALVVVPAWSSRTAWRSAGGPGARPGSRPRARADDAGAARRWRRHVPFALFAAALVLVCFALARPTDEPRAAAAGSHGDPRLRRVEQHARQGSRADPDRGGEDGRPRLRRAGSRRRSASVWWRSATAPSPCSGRAT